MTRYYKTTMFNKLRDATCNYLRMEILMIIYKVLHEKEEIL